MNFPQEIPVAQIDLQNPEYKNLLSHWEHLRKLNDGGQTMRECANEFLMKRPMEPGDVYADRVNRFTYINHLGNIIGWYVSALFKDPPTVILRKPDATAGPGNPEASVLTEGPESDAMNAFMQDCDGSGRGLFDFWTQEVEPRLLLYRRAYVLLDLPTSPEYNNVDAQRKTGALRPHLLCYSPQDVINWDTDDQGNLNWIIVKVQSQVQVDPFQPLVAQNLWYIFTRDQVALYQSELKPEGGTANVLDGTGSTAPEKRLASLVPGYPRLHALSDQQIVPFFVQTLHSMHWIANRVASPLCRLLNLENSYDWSLEQTNLALLVLYTSEEVDKVTRGEANFLKLAPTDKAAFLEQSGTGFEASQRRVTEIREEVYRLAYLVQQGRSSSATASSQSGISKEADMIPARDVLSALGDRDRGSLQKLLQTVADRMDLNVSVDVQGLSFLDRSEMAELEVLERASTIAQINSPRLEREVAKRIARMEIPDSNREVFAVIDQEIDNNPTAGEMQQQQLDQSNAMKLQQAVRLSSPKAFEDVEE